MALPRRWRALYTLREHGVQLVTGVTVEEITDAGVVYSQHGERQVAPADHVIIATGVSSGPRPRRRLSGCAAAIHLVGDCASAGYIRRGDRCGAAQIAGALVNA